MTRWLLIGASLAAIGSAGLSTLAASAQTPVTLTFAAHYNDAQMAPLTACFRAYEAQNPNVRIVYQQSKIEDFLQTLQTARIAGSAPDIYNVYSIWGAKLVGDGILAEPPEDMVRFVTENYEPTTVQSATVEDAVWGVPAEVSLYLLVYNKKLFAEAGINEPPRDWAGVLAAAEKIAKRDSLGKVTTAGYAFGPTVANATHPFRALLLSKGVPLFNDDLTGTNLTNPAAAEILSGEAELFSRGLTSASNVVRDFPSGSVGMMIAANWFEQTLREGLGEAFDETVGVAPIPGGPDWKTYQYSFYQAVDAESPNAAEAWKLIRWLNEPREAGKRSCTGDMLIALGSLTANRADIAASEAELGDAFSTPYVEALSGGRAVPDPNIRQTPEADKVLRTAIEEVWLGRKDAQNALTEADEAISAILAEPF